MHLILMPLHDIALTPTKHVLCPHAHAANGASWTRHSACTWSSLCSVMCVRKGPTKWQCTRSCSTSFTWRCCDCQVRWLFVLQFLPFHIISCFHGPHHSRDVAAIVRCVLRLKKFSSTCAYTLNTYMQMHANMKMQLHAKTFTH